MGQSASAACKDFIPDTVDSVQFQIKKHNKIFQDLNSLSYEEFLKNLEELNELSRKCIDKEGNQLVFAVNRGTNQIQWLWKAFIKIAAVSINPNSRKINSIKIINLNQFLHIFNTMVTHVKAIQDLEERQRTSPKPYPFELDHKFDFDNTGEDAFEDCIICLERKPEVILPCLHKYCLPCITQWNENKKSCPICDQAVVSSNDTWVQLEIPHADEINEEIVSQLQKITADKN